MRQSAETAKAKAQGRSKSIIVLTTPVKVSALRPAREEFTGNESDLSANLMIGALLYSPFASHRSEMIRGLLPNDDEE